MSVLYDSGSTVDLTQYGIVYIQVDEPSLDPVMSAAEWFADEYAQYGVLSTYKSDDTGQITSQELWDYVRSMGALMGAKLGLDGIIQAQGSNYTLNVIADPTATCADVAGGTCSYTVSPTLFSAVAANGGSITVNVSTASTCEWSATSNTSWITIASGASGTGNGTVTLSVASNAGDAREGTVTVAGQTVTVKQMPVCSFTVSPTSFSLAYGAQSGETITVTANDSRCQWAASTAASWISLSATSGTGNGSLTFDATENPDHDQRSGTITVGGQDVTVTQDAAPCSYSVSPTTLTFAYGGGSQNVDITTDAACSWSVTGLPSWLTVSAGSGSGSTTLTLTAAENTGGQRTADITVAGQTVHTTQSAQAPSSLPLNSWNVPAGVYNRDDYYECGTNQFCTPCSDCDTCSTAPIMAMLMARWDKIYDNTNGVYDFTYIQTFLDQLADQVVRIGDTCYHRKAVLAITYYEKMPNSESYYYVFGPNFVEENTSGGYVIDIRCRSDGSDCISSDPNYCPNFASLSNSTAFGNAMDDMIHQLRDWLANNRPSSWTSGSYLDLIGAIGAGSGYDRESQLYNPGITGNATNLDAHFSDNDLYSNDMAEWIKWLNNKWRYYFPNTPLFEYLAPSPWTSRSDWVGYGTDEDPAIGYCNAGWAPDSPSAYGVSGASSEGNGIWETMDSNRFTLPLGVEPKLLGSSYSNPEQVLWWMLFTAMHRRTSLVTISQDWTSAMTNVDSLWNTTTGRSLSEDIFDMIKSHPYLGNWAFWIAHQPECESDDYQQADPYPWRRGLTENFPNSDASYKFDKTDAVGCDGNDSTLPDPDSWYTNSSDSFTKMVGRQYVNTAGIELSRQVQSGDQDNVLSGASAFDIYVIYHATDDATLEYRVSGGTMTSVTLPATSDVFSLYKAQSVALDYDNPSQPIIKITGTADIVGVILHAL